MADRAACAEDPFAALMIVTRDVWIIDRAFQCKSPVNKAFQAETTAHVRHGPKLTPRQVREVAFRFARKQMRTP
jgi:hypothetical protein